LKGRYVQGKGTEEGIKKGIEYSAAIEKDPGHALAGQIWLGPTGRLLTTGYFASESRSEVEEAVRKALELTTCLAEAHMVLAASGDFRLELASC